MLSFHVSGSPGFVFLNPLSLATDEFQIGPRRQGFAAPLRALDGCGPIRETWLFTRERGGMGLVVGFFRAVLAGPKGTFRSYQPPEP